MHNTIWCPEEIRCVSLDPTDVWQYVTYYCSMGPLTLIMLHLLCLICYIVEALRRACSPFVPPPVCSNWQPLRAGVDRLVQRGKPVLLWCLTSLETVSPEWFHATAAEIPIPLRFRPLRDSDGLKAHWLLHPQVEHSVITGASCLGSYWQMLSINPADISIPTSCRPHTTCLNPWPVFSRSARRVDTQLFDVPLDPELLNIAHVLVLTLSLCRTGVQFWECERIVRML